MGTTIVILAMHGAPPNDLPKHELAELFGLHSRLEHAAGPERAALEQRHDELDRKVRTWPRTAQNDPFYFASKTLAAALSQATGDEVIVGFNEFCAPGLDEALEQAIARGAERVVVVTPMMTAGGEHAEVDIPAAIQRAKAHHPAISILYAWPFQVSEVAQFLATNVARCVEEYGRVHS